MPALQLRRPLLLASASPRRAALLRQIGLDFVRHAAHGRETPPHAGEDLREWAPRAALDKARAVAATLPDAPMLLLGADTVVLLPADGEAPPGLPLLDGAPVHVLGKPDNAAAAVVMLRALSGRRHAVLSAFALLAHPEGEAVTDLVVTDVLFRTLSHDEIDDYVASGEPLDKAGAYGIQGRGAILVERIAGDYATIVGLPLSRLWQALLPWRDTGSDTD